MIKNIFFKIKQIRTVHYGIESTFFEIGKKYKVKDGFVCRNMVFIKDEELVCLHNCLSWYDGFFVISFQQNHSLSDTLIDNSSCFVLEQLVSNYLNVYHYQALINKA